MNCKPGDLAVIVRSATGESVGRIVTVLRWLGEVSGFVGDDRWEIDCALPTVLGGVANHVRDACLRPIRPGDISDEAVRDLYAPKLPEVA